MHSLTIQSPAKLNLYLKIVGKYPNGYHRLVTLFHRISLKDTLRLVKKKEGFSLRCSTPGLPLDESNLITKSYRALQAKFPALGGVSVHLTKRIPVGSGLGGGSSNSAAFLLGMKKLYQIPIAPKTLASLGGKLGADIPFFIYNLNQAIGLERGDVIIPKAFKRGKWFVLVTSGEGLSTKIVYENFARNFRPASLTKAKRTVRIASNLLDCKDFRKASGVLQNDLEQPAFMLKPAIRQMITKIEQFGVPLVRMSGSGPTVFAVLSRQQEAEKLRRQLKQTLPSEEIVICHSF